MSDELAKELIVAIRQLTNKLDADKSKWITGEEVLKRLGIVYTKGTARKHLQRLRANGTLR